MPGKTKARKLWMSLVRGMASAFKVLSSTYSCFRRVKVKTEKAKYAEKVQADSSVK